MVSRAARTSLFLSAAPITSRGGTEATLPTRRAPRRYVVFITLGLLAALPLLPVIPTDLQLPGTQPGEVATLQTAAQCDNCHGGFDPVSEPDRPWRGSMMAHAGRDPLFWAAMAIAEQDFPQSGDYCLRCHAPRGWIEGRSTPTNGSALLASDSDGVDCAICHQLTNPDRSEHTGVQNPPFLAHDGGSPAEGYYGSGMMVLAGGNARYGPYANTTARHAFQQSLFHRSSALCGTCHDVSNPVVGDLAHNHGAQTPLPPGTWSGVPNAPVASKAAFQNPPYRYGVVERTFSEHMASALSTMPVRNYLQLPAELQRGALKQAREAALLAGRQGDYEDGSTRLFSCQTCHMQAVVGRGASQNNAPLRLDIPSHDLVGGNTWVPSLIRWANQNGRLRLGGGMTQAQLQALDAGVPKARANLRNAAALDMHDDVLHVVNLTGHKLISGYPEGRRMWLSVRWLNRTGQVVRHDGAYGPLTVQVAGNPVTVMSLQDPQSPHLRLYSAKHGITQEWAQQLLSLGWPANLPVSYDRISGAIVATLGQVAALPQGSAMPSFHFVLNNTLMSDTRIPPYGMSYDAALQRNILPVPATAYGNPGPGGTFRHWDEVAMQPPAGAVRADLELLYQSTSWEYVQFLLLANLRQDAFLANVGRDLYDGWLATGMSSPEVMATARWCGLPGTGEDLRLQSAVGNAAPDETCAKRAEPGATLQLRLQTPGGTFAGAMGVFAFQFHATAGPGPQPFLTGLQLDRIDGQAAVFGLPATGAHYSVTIPGGLVGASLRVQGIIVSPLAVNGSFATTKAHDIEFR